MTRPSRPAAAISSLRALVALVLAGALLAGCTGAPEEPDASARPVTTEESQLLAIARFRSFDAGSRPFTTEVRERGADLHLRGWIDHESHVGYATVTGAFEPEALLWTGATVGIIPTSPDADGNPPLPIPSLDDQAWLSHALDPSASRLDSLLAAIGALGSDRPDNPLLLQQAGALWLRADEVDGMADCVKAMRDAVALPVTIKHRIGLDASEDYGFVRDFVGTVAAAGSEVFIVHARNAVLKGLSPKENREVPRLRYDVVHRLKREFPALTIVLNGGLDNWTAIERELAAVDGVMLGRTAYHDPMVLALVDWRLFGVETQPPTREKILRAMVPYADAQRARGVPLRAIARHMLGLYHGMPGGRRFRQILSDATRLRDATSALLLEALLEVEPALADV